MSRLRIFDEDNPTTPRLASRVSTVATVVWARPRLSASAAATSATLESPRQSTRMTSSCSSLRAMSSDSGATGLPLHLSYYSCSPRRKPLQQARSHTQRK